MVHVNTYPTLFSVIRPDIDYIDSLQPYNKNPQYAIGFWDLKIVIFNIYLISIAFYYDSGRIWLVPQPGFVSFTEEIIAKCYKNQKINFETPKPNCILRILVI